MFIEWTATARPLSWAERHAVYVYENRSIHPWWLSGHGGSLFLVAALQGLGALGGRGELSIPFMVAAVLSLFWVWEQRALCELIERCESDLRLLDAGGPPTDVHAATRLNMAERHARRVYRQFRESGRPWGLIAASVIGIVAIGLSPAPTGVVAILTFALLIAMVAHTWWEQRGLCDLLERHDTELQRHGARGLT